jgi:quercetin dioxygenase-like cupin family protein
MQIVTSRPDTVQGPAEWFTGIVWIDEIAAPPAPCRLRVNSVHFTPGARTAWHRHPLGQALHVTEGAGLVQHRGGSIQEVRAGDTVWTEPDEWHWHGAAPRTFMTHLAVMETAEDGASAEWAEHVSDADYPA